MLSKKQLKSLSIKKFYIFIFIATVSLRIPRYAFNLNSQVPFNEAGEFFFNNNNYCLNDDYANLDV